MDSRIMGKPGVDCAHLACHEQMAGVLNGEKCVEGGRVGHAGWSLGFRRGLLWCEEGYLFDLTRTSIAKSRICSSGAKRPRGEQTQRSGKCRRCCGRPPYQLAQSFRVQTCM